MCSQSKYLHVVGVVDVSISKQSSENRIAQQLSGTKTAPDHTNNTHSGITVNLGQLSATWTSQPRTLARSSDYLSAPYEEARNTASFTGNGLNHFF